MKHKNVILVTLITVAPFVEVVALPEEEQFDKPEKNIVAIPPQTGIYVYGTM